MRFVLLTLGSVVLWATAACVPVPSPFAGPGIAEQTGLFVSVDEKRIAVTTSMQVDLASGPDLASFATHLDETELYFADEPPGFVGASVRRVMVGVDGWTLSVWSDENAAAHFLEETWLATAPGGAALRSVNWELPTTTPAPPTWGEALLELKLRGEDVR